MVVGGGGEEGGGFWTGSLRPQPSSAIQKTPGVFKMLHPGRLAREAIVARGGGLGGGGALET